MCHRRGGSLCLLRAQKRTPRLHAMSLVLFHFARHVYGSEGDGSCVSSTWLCRLALVTVVDEPELTRPGLALTSAEAVDHANAYPNVGSIMVWRDPNNPLGLPGGLAGRRDRRPHPPADDSHRRTLRRTSRSPGFRPSLESSSASRRTPSTSPPGSTSIAPAARASLILRFRGPAPRRVARSTTPTGCTSRGSAMSASVFSTSPCSASGQPSWPTAASTMSVSRARE